MLHEIMDLACADALEVDVEVYIEKIEKTTYKRAEIIISALMSEDEKQIIKARRIFNLIKTKNTWQQKFTSAERFRG